MKLMPSPPLFLAVLFVLLCPSAFGAAFVKFDGVDGEATDANHKGWSDAQSVEMKTSKEIDPTTGNPTGKVKVEKFCLTKTMDKSSPLLLAASVGDDKTPKVTIEFTHDPAGGKECSVYLKYELTDVIVTSYSSSADKNNPPGTEEICVTFATLTVTYIPCNPDGTPGTPVVTTYTRN